MRMHPLLLRLSLRLSMLGAAAILTGSLGAGALSAQPRPPMSLDRGGVNQIDDQPGYIPTQEEEQLDPQFRHQVVFYRTTEQPGTIVVDTPGRFLYLVMGNNRAMRY